MRNIVIIALFVLFVSGCGIARHSGKVETFNAKGESTGHYIATLDRPMSIKVVGTDGTIVEADSRGESTWGQFLKGIMEMATIGLLVD